MTWLYFTPSDISKPCITTADACSMLMRTASPLKDTSYVVVDKLWSNPAFLFPLTLHFSPIPLRVEFLVSLFQANLLTLGCSALCLHPMSICHNTVSTSVWFNSLVDHSKQCITESLHPHVSTPSPPSSLPPPCCFTTSKVRLITILRGDKWLREGCSLLWNPSHGFQQRVDIFIIYFHPTHGL